MPALIAPSLRRVGPCPLPCCSSFHVLLPALIIAAAFNIDPSLLWRNLPLVLMLTIPMMVPSAGITGMLLNFGLGHASGFPPDEHEPRIRL